MLQNEKSRPEVRAALGRGGAFYLPVIRYTRSPASFLLDSTASPIFLVRVPETKPLIEWFCQPVALAISAIVAPPLRCSRSRTICFLLPSRGLLAVAFFVAGFVAFLLAGFFASFLAAGLLAVFLALGALCFLLAFLFEVAFSGATCAPGSATAAVCVVVLAFVVMVLVLWRLIRAPHSSLGSRGTSSARSHGHADLPDGKANAPGTTSFRS